MFHGLSRKRKRRRGMDANNNGSNDSHPVANSLAKSRILLVDDNDNIRAVFQEGLERRGFEVIPASSVNAALNLISTEKFDVLLSDLHMPNAGDGLTVVSAMRHANPKAVTLLLSAFPAMGAAAQPILLQADEILVKPMNVQSLIDTIRHRIALGPPRSRLVESVAAILERSSE